MIGYIKKKKIAPCGKSLRDVAIASILVVSDIRQVYYNQSLWCSPCIIWGADIKGVSV